MLAAPEPEGPPRMPTPSDAETEPRAADVELWRGALRSAAVFVASRVGVVLAMGIAGVVREDWPLRRALSHWDGGWYLLVADAGYARALPPPGAPANTNIAFFPLFPTILRGVSEVTGLSTFRSALAVNLV